MTQRKRVQFIPQGESMTRQSHKQECDINNIVNRFVKNGVVTHFNKYQPQYADLTGADFTAWQQKVANAQSMFEELPSHVRNKFNNNPASFLDFVQDEKNSEEMRKLGLAKGTRENPATSSDLNPNTPPMSEKTKPVTAPAPEDEKQ